MNHRRLDQNQRLSTLKNKDDEAATLESIGDSYIELGKVNEGIERYQAAFQLASQTNNTLFQFTNLLKIGDAYASENRKEEALAEYKKAKTLEEKIEALKKAEGGN